MRYEQRDCSILVYRAYSNTQIMRWTRFRSTPSPASRWRSDRTAGISISDRGNPCANRNQQQVNTASRGSSFMRRTIARRKVCAGGEEQPLPRDQEDCRWFPGRRAGRGDRWSHSSAPRSRSSGPSGRSSRPSGSPPPSSQASIDLPLSSFLELQERLPPLRAGFRAIYRDSSNSTEKIK